MDLVHKGGGVFQAKFNVHVFKSTIPDCQFVPFSLFFFLESRKI